MRRDQNSILVDDFCDLFAQGATKTLHEVGSRALLPNDAAGNPLQPLCFSKCVRGGPRFVPPSLLLLPVVDRLAPGDAITGCGNGLRRQRRHRLRRVLHHHGPAEVRRLLGGHSRAALHDELVPCCSALPTPSIGRGPAPARDRLVMQSPSNKEHPRHEATAHSLRQRLWYTLEIYNYSRASKLIAIMVSPHRCGFTAAVVAGGPWVSRQHCDDTNHAWGGGAPAK